jgi:hypothetical protein
VDPRPAQEAELREKRAALAGSVDDEERSGLEEDIRQLERALGHHGGFVRRFLLGLGHRSIPW